MRPALLSLLAVGLSLGGSAQQASNFPISPEKAQAYGCGALCQTILQAANQQDLQTIGSKYDWDFYTVAANFSNGKPGDLLKLKPVDPTTLTVTSGISVYRIQYVSEDLDGKLLPVTGFIALPNSVPDSGKFPLVAYAHGTIGLYAGCTPSNGRNLYDYNSWSLLTQRGYAVYTAFPAHAKDVFHSVKAARQAFGAVLSKSWLSVGHSQGGGAVWKLAEDITTLSRKHGVDEAANYLGTVALSPATKVWDLAKYAATVLVNHPTDFHRFVVAGLLPFFQLAIKRVNPKFGTSLLGDVMAKRMGLADEAQLCVSAMMGITLDLTMDELSSASKGGPSAEDVRIAEAFQNATAPANGGKTLGPMLVVQGVNDTSILAEITERAWTSACADGNSVDLLLYPKQDHSGVIVAAAPTWLNWVDDRFRSRNGVSCGETSPKACSKIVKTPFDYKYVKVDLELDLSSLGLA